MSTKPKPPPNVLGEVSKHVNEFNGTVREMIESSQNLVHTKAFAEHKDQIGHFDLIAGLMIEAIKQLELKPMKLGGPYLYKYKQYFTKNGPDWRKADFASEVDQNNPNKTAILELLATYQDIYNKGGFTDEWMEWMRTMIRKLLKSYSRVLVLVADYDFW